MYFIYYWELCGKMTAEAAQATGLPVGIPVAASLIDAHAGGVGIMGCDAMAISKDFISRLGEHSLLILFNYNIRFQ